MFPLRDENPTTMTPVITLAVVVITTAIWVIYQGAGFEPRLSQSVCELGAVPAQVLGRTLEPVMTPRGPVLPCPDPGSSGWYTPITSIFLHGGWFHLIGNMWFLWVFGDNVEESMGHGRFVGFYLLCGVLAALAQIVAQPGSPIPMVGASGAISGVMGGYLILYPKVRVHNLLFLGFFITTISLPAWVMLVYWVFIQAVSSVGTFVGGATGGVAFLAHLGGFVAGAALIKLFAKPTLVVAHKSHGPVPPPRIGRWR